MNRTVWILPLLSAISLADPTLKADILSLSADQQALTLEWFGRSNWTYTLQESDNLWQWEVIDAVFTGSGQALTLSLPPASRAQFLRLRSSSSGDTNFNGLPDIWEWSVFGYLDVDPEKDPDGDGRITYDEFLEGTDPLDFYDGITPHLELLCPEYWTVETGSLSIHALEVRIERPDGTPWADAPLIATIPSGYPGLFADYDDQGAPEASMEIRTDAEGRIQPWLTPVRFLAPETALPNQEIRLEAGAATRSIQLVITSGPPPAPPRGIVSKPGPNHSVLLTWRGDPGTAQSVRAEHQGPNGAWTVLVDMPVNLLDPPNPDTRRYSLTIEP